MVEVPALLLTCPAAGGRGDLFNWSRAAASAPCWMSKSTTSLWPIAAATWRGALLNSLWAATSAPCWMSKSTTSLWPLWAAKWRGAVLKSSRAATSAPCWRSKSTTSLWHIAAATWRGAVPKSSRAATSAPCWMRKSTTSLWPLWAAKCRGVWSILSRAATLALWWSINSTACKVHRSELTKSWSGVRSEKSWELMSMDTVSCFRSAFSCCTSPSRAAKCKRVPPMCKLCQSGPRKPRWNPMASIMRRCSSWGKQQSKQTDQWQWKHEYVCGCGLCAVGKMTLEHLSQVWLSRGVVECSLWRTLRQARHSASPASAAPRISLTRATLSGSSGRRKALPSIVSSSTASSSVFPAEHTSYLAEGAVQVPTASSNQIWVGFCCVHFCKSERSLTVAQLWIQHIQQEDASAIGCNPLKWIGLWSLTPLFLTPLLYSPCQVQDSPSTWRTCSKASGQHQVASFTPDGLEQIQWISRQLTNI